MGDVSPSPGENSSLNVAMGAAMATLG